MTEYSIEFSKKLAEVALTTISKEPNDIESKRVALYISRLSIELSLKNLLEKSGKSPQELQNKFSHNLSLLLSNLKNIEIQKRHPLDNRQWESAAYIFDLNISFLGVYNTTLDQIINAEIYGASKYPGQIRYGNDVADFPPEAVANAAQILAAVVSDDIVSVRAVKP